MSAVTLYGMKGTYDLLCVLYSFFSSPPFLFLSSLSLSLSLSLSHFVNQHFFGTLENTSDCVFDVNICACVLGYVCAICPYPLLVVADACVCGSISTLNDGYAHMSHVTFPFFSFQNPNIPQKMRSENAEF